MIALTSMFGEILTILLKLTDVLTKKIYFAQALRPPNSALNRIYSAMTAGLDRLQCILYGKGAALMDQPGCDEIERLTGCGELGEGAPLLRF